ncbi:MAG: hypothetical protein RIS94_2708 [Pseudomonadota bacterium]|jgi:hypothetical protein
MALAIVVLPGVATVIVNLGSISYQRLNERQVPLPCDKVIDLKGGAALIAGSGLLEGRW